MATVLKHDRAATTDRSLRAATFTLSDMASQGDDYVGTVRREAAKVVQQAKAETDAIRRRAEETGRAAAEAEIDKRIDERLAKQMGTLAPALRSTIDQLADAKGDWLAHWQEAALGVAKAIAERIVRRELAEDPSLTLEWTREALTLAASSSELTVKLHPGDHDALRGEVEKLVEEFSRVSVTRIVADPSITPGGCRLETRHGVVDMQIEKQLERLTEELR